jgi:hypothetical protein
MIYGMTGPWKGHIDFAKVSGRLDGASRFKPAGSVCAYWIYYENAKKPPIIVYAMEYELIRMGLFPKSSSTKDTVRMK